jgi:NAD(P)-dependent dehydrogenase (short-subunit alcohol dehydrogenase family)
MWMAHAVIMPHGGRRGGRIGEGCVGRGNLSPMGTYVVTGSASGIGAATVALLVGAGHRVVGVDLHDADVVADLGTSEGRAAASVALAEASPQGWDGAVIAAGIGPHERPLSRIAAVNLFGALACADALREGVAARGGAAVVVCSNSAGITPVEDQPFFAAFADEDEAAALAMVDDLEGELLGALVYGASKLALGRAMRRRVARWGSDGARLNAVAPGPVRTPLLQGSYDDPELGPLVDALPVPWGTPPVDPEQVAGVIGFLLSPASAPVHGSVLFADGGTDALLRPDHV